MNRRDLLKMAVAGAAVSTVRPDKAPTVEVRTSRHDVAYTDVVTPRHVAKGDMVLIGGNFIGLAAHEAPAGGLVHVQTYGVWEP